MNLIDSIKVDGFWFKVVDGVLVGAGWVIWVQPERVLLVGPMLSMGAGFLREKGCGIWYEGGWRGSRALVRRLWVVFFDVEEKVVVDELWG